MVWLKGIRVTFRACVYFPARGRTSFEMALAETATAAAAKVIIQNYRAIPALL